MRMSQASILFSVQIPTVGWITFDLHLLSLSTQTLHSGQTVPGQMASSINAQLATLPAGFSHRSLSKKVRPIRGARIQNVT